MRNTIVIIALISSLSSTNCQTFKGTVYDRSTDSTLSFAVIYISGTSIGTAADKHGNFKLDISKYSSMPITISLIGYYSTTISEHSSNKMYHIYLSPKIKELNEVLVKAKSNWNRNLRIFKREFLGESENASECDILNEKDLRFHYNPDSGALSAFSLKPILIHNKALAYTITYYLDKFNYSSTTNELGQLTESFIMLGNYLFKDELLTLDESERRQVEERRKSTYLGSRMHFFRLLYQGNLIQSRKYHVLLSDDNLLSKSFSIGSKAPIYSNSLVFKNDSSSGYIKNKGDLIVKYRLNSIITVKMDSVYFEKDGYYDPIGVDFSGAMSKQRIGDLLPFEYLMN